MHFYDRFQYFSTPLRRRKSNFKSVHDTCSTALTIKFEFITRPKRHIIRVLLAHSFRYTKYTLGATTTQRVSEATTDHNS